MNISLLMVVLYIIVTTLISFYFIKKNKNSKSFAVASGGLSLPLIVALLFSEMIAGAGTVGNAATGFSTGISSVWGNWSMSIGSICFVIFAIKFYRTMGDKYGVISVPEAFEKLFDFKCRMVLLAVVVLTYGILFSTQAPAAAAILAPMIGINRTTMTIIVAMLFVIVTVVGGMKGIAVMNILHSIIMYLGIFTIAFLSIWKIGGVDVLINTLPSTYFSLGEPDWATTIAAVLGTAFSYLAAATLVNVVFTAKSVKIAKKGTILAAILIVPFAMGPSLIGMCGKVLYPNAPAAGIIYLVASEMGPLFSGLISMAILAAIWSTGPALLLIISTTITRDFYRVIVNKNPTDKQELNFTRSIVVVFGITSSFLGMHGSSILGTMLGAFQIRSVVGIVLVTALFWPRVNANSAFWSMLSGGIIAAGWFFLGNPFGIATFWPAAFVTLLVLIPLSLKNVLAISNNHSLYQEALEHIDKVERIL